MHIEKIANKNERCRFELVRRNVIFSAWGNSGFIIQMYNFINKVLKSKFNVGKRLRNNYIVVGV